MKRKIIIVPPEQRDTVETALGALLGPGWGRGCLSPWPQPTSAATANTPPKATAYLCDAHLGDEAAAKLAALVAEDAARTLEDARVVTEKQPDGPRKTLSESLAAHAAKEGK
jgi:hypothetical protein